MEELFLESDIREMSHIFDTTILYHNYNLRMNNWVTNPEVGFKRIYDWEEDEDLIL